MKKKKKYLIATASDRKYGDFLVEHWLYSLWENVRLSKIQILVLDYGLSKAQRFYLEKHKILVHSCTRDGHVVNLRFRDLYSFLKIHPYEQILMCDSGDLIFQDDISFLFEEHIDEYRAVCEDLAPLFDYFIKTDYFYKEDIDELKETLILKKMINAGFIIAPYKKMLHLCEVLVSKTKDKHQFGPDQILINYVLHKEGFVELPTKYNFIPVTCLEEFYIKDGFFYNKKGQKIPVVHNAGNLNFFRSIENFGYNSHHNQIKEDILKGLRTFYTYMHLLEKPKKEFFLVSKKIEDFISKTLKAIDIEEQKSQFFQLLKLIEKTQKKTGT
ncbi:MAG: glycosyl transferase family 8 [Leptospiraceae bacterium]|nr:glycosyl transferase family 8 [Leptospiraceae bacterium]MDW7976616.1 glycosyl transferase family 8 [Leptospiraceae bacterium]